MPEYLAPGVYVEEIDIGAKPIEGVSTSTAGFVGVTERGPLNRPILITSAGEYDRWFGGLLPIDDFVDPADPHRAHCFLPHAIYGFFTNGGKRAYVLRVAPDEAQRAALTLYDRGLDGDLGTVLLRRAGVGDGLAASPLLLLDTTALAGGTVRIGDGSRAEYLTTPGAVAAPTFPLPLDRPLARSHATGGATVSVAAPAPIAGGPYTLGANASAGATVVVVDSPLDLTVQGLPFLLQLASDGVSALAAVPVAPTSLGGSLYRVELNEALPTAYVSGAAIDLFTSAAATDTLASPAAPGDSIAFVTAAVAFANRIVEFDQGTPAHEARMLGQLTQLALSQPVPAALPAGASVRHVGLADAGGATAKTLTAAASAGARVLALGSRTGLAVGDVVRIGAGLDEEFGLIVAIPGDDPAASPNAGIITLAHPITGAHAFGTVVFEQDPPLFPAGGHQASATLLAVSAGANALLVSAGQAYAATDGVAIQAPGAAPSFHRIGASVIPANVGAVTLTAGLARVHEVGEMVVDRSALIDVEALDVGGWGNRLLVSVSDETTGLLSRAQTLLLNPPLQMRLTSLTGVEAGTLLEVTNPATAARVLLKVRRTDASNNSVTLDPPGLDAAALAALGPIGGPLEIRSREFALTVRLRRRPDPAVPSRNTQIQAFETFRSLSMDHRHSRYFPAVIGDIAGPVRLEDGRPEGESLYIRVADTAPDVATMESIRQGPEALTDRLPSGAVEPARHALAGGDDSMATMVDPVYLGLDDAEPLNRTGLQALRNIPQISIVGIPGQASGAVQAGLIAHCELMRYRFAVLDAATADATLADVQTQRQAFDTKYAALYYPWYSIPDPMPDNLAVIRAFNLPPSGHIMGIYARVDEERGVHKAPANEVVRGITGLSRRLNKGEHDILNPSPVNICVTRDFRPEGRGIRVWGARCITSDSDHKYIPVRRLLIFLEQSIERGLQWVVFEPNAPALWARVRLSVANFLTDVWRSGALEGAKSEEAFFVKCDRTTMTQSDIDNGRLICLIGVAPVKPAEFVIIRIGLFTAQADA